MASMNFNPFNDNWFKNPPKLPFQPINLAPSLFRPHLRTPNFASLSNPFSKKPVKSEPDEKKPGKYQQVLDQLFWACENLPDYRHAPEVERILQEDPIAEKKENPTQEEIEENEDEEKPGKYKQMLKQFDWECKNLPDYRHAPEVERILQEDPIAEKKENPTREEIEENERWWAEFRSSPVVQFLARAEEIADKLNEIELEKNSVPYRREDKKLWQAVPHVIGLDGRPMPRKAIKTDSESDDKFWDFARQFFFGLWGFRQRPYPPCRPIDVAQAVGYKRLEKRYYDFIMKTGNWFYKDRLGRTRGPMELIQLKSAWGAGIIDKHTFIWGDDMDEWAPISMIYAMESAIATWEVRLGAAATACLHKLQKGIPPWVPLKGHEDKSYKQMQEEAYESKRRDIAVLKANDGVWPGERIPSHALFLWAGGSELTTLLEEDYMPNKFIPKYLRKDLAKIIPGLRPWEVLSIEQAMDQITFGGKWFREPLGTFTTGPPYIQHWNKDFLRLFKVYQKLSARTYKKLEKTVPGFNTIMEMIQADADKKMARRNARRAQKKAEKNKPYRTTS